MKKRLYECTKVLRSKNSGPPEIALDCLFDDEQVYRKIEESGIINRALVAELYHIPEDLITSIVPFNPTFGFEITFTRRVSFGTNFDRGVHDVQQHAPLMGLLIEV